MSSGLSLAGNGSFQDEPEREPEVRSGLSPEGKADELERPDAAAGWQRVHKRRSEDRARVEISRPRESRTESSSCQREGHQSESFDVVRFIQQCLLNGLGNMKFI